MYKGTCEYLVRVLTVVAICFYVPSQPYVGSWHCSVLSVCSPSIFFLEGGLVFHDPSQFGKVVRCLYLWKSVQWQPYVTSTVAFQVCLLWSFNVKFSGGGRGHLDMAWT